MKRLIWSLSVLTASIVFGYTISEAGTTSATLNVSANVQPGCNVQTTPLNFGDYSGSTLVTAGGGVTVLCNANTPYNISLGGGSNFDGVSRRVYNGTSHAIGYFLYHDNSMTTQWGDSDTFGTYPSGSSKADVGTGSSQMFSVYAKLVGGSLVPSGTYTDVVNVTVNY